MRSFITLTVITFSALTAAVPHALGHLRSNQLAPVAARSPIDTPNLSPIGTCGGTTGYQCAPGFCCSTWGYCGNTAAYCGGDSDDGNSTATSDIPPPAAADFSPAALASSVASWIPKFTAPAAAPPAASVAAPPAATTFVPSTTVGASASAAPPPEATTFVPSTTIAASATAAPPPNSVPAPAPSTGSATGLGSSYKMYSGDGDTVQGWPAESEWMDFETMWEKNAPLIADSCTEFGEANNSDEETSDLKSAIQSVGSSSGVDPRFILAIVMQESKGCVRAPTTNFGVTNPGLMQSHDGTGSCNNGAVQNPCPMSEITQMIKDGVEGTSSGEGLEQAMQQSDTADVSKFYKAARIFNSGSIAAGGNLDAGIATHCYASDVANRLTGWVDAATLCNLG